MAGALALVAVHQRDNARAARDLAIARQRLAQSRQLSTESQVNLSASPARSLLQALDAYALRDTTEARSVVLRGLQRQPRLAAWLPAPVAGPLAYSADGTRLATVGPQQRVTIWQAAPPRRRLADLRRRPAGRLRPDPAGPEQRYVGLVHRGPPRGVEDLGGALIGGVFSISRMQAGKQEMLWLERRVSAASAAKPTWRVVSVLALPARKASEVVAVADCELGARRQRQVVAIWATDRGPEAPARLAWLADGRGGRFQPIDARRVHCPEELAG